ncbi:MAG: hypothetical protein ABIY70_26315 [Capsulimonas sp.]|uniref:hypothetical protein n=1 Tax=Capsulimonas sp. TaxID=2494211 RepID=UPI003267552D
MNGSRTRRSFHAILTAISLAAVCAALCPSIGRADGRVDSNVPPGTPPEIAAIMRKVQAGKRPTGADIAKLQAWSQKLVEKVNGQVGNGSQYRPPTRTAPGSQAAAQRGEQEGIPCTIHVSANYSGHSENSSEEYQTNYTARAMLYPRLNGTGDYWATMMDPNAEVSSFRFEPLAAASGATIAKAGGGSYHFRSKDNKGNGSDSKGTLTQGIFSMQLVTTGKSDLLYPSGGGGGVAKGTTTTYDKDRSVTSNDPGGSGGGLSVPFAAENVLLGPGKSTPIPKMTLSYRALVAAIKSGATATITGNENASNLSVGGMTYSAQSSISITLRPKPMDILIEPVNKRLYEAWEPMPDATDTSHPELFGDPKPLAVHIVMHDASKPPTAKSDGGLTQPNTQIGGLIDIYLHDVSDQKGVCMDFPADSPAKKGLFFPADQPPGIVRVDEQHVKTTSATAREATVNVCARDTGAYGKIDAKCETLGLDSKCVRNTDTFLSIPLDDDFNNIADQYEIEKGIFDRKLGANWDEEDKPAGWKTPGDGFSLYEEYRGFLIDNPDHSETFQRLGQEKRKLFVFPTGDDREIYRQGADLYANASGVDVYYVHQRARLKDIGGTFNPRWINFNTTPYSTPQAAVWMMDLHLPDKTAFTRPVAGSDEARPQCPMTTDCIAISRPAITHEIDDWAGVLPANTPMESLFPDAQQGCTDGHIDVAEAEATMQARKPALVDRLILFSAAHELGHATGGRHHGLDQYLDYASHNNLTKKQNKDAQEKWYSSGDHDCLMRYWHFDTNWTEFMLFLAGKWNLLTPSTGGKWGFCSADLPNMHMKE